MPDQPSANPGSGKGLSFSVDRLLQPEPAAPIRHGRLPPRQPALGRVTAVLHFASAVCYRRLRGPALPARCLGGRTPPASPAESLQKFPRKFCYVSGVLP